MGLPLVRQEVQVTGRAFPCTSARACAPIPSDRKYPTVLRAPETKIPRGPEPTGDRATFAVTPREPRTKGRSGSAGRYRSARRRSRSSRPPERARTRPARTRHGARSMRTPRLPRPRPSRTRRASRSTRTSRGSRAHRQLASRAGNGTAAEQCNVRRILECPRSGPATRLRLHEHDSDPIPGRPQELRHRLVSRSAESHHISVRGYPIEASELQTCADIYGALLAHGRTAVRVTE